MGNDRRNIFDDDRGQSIIFAAIVLFVIAAFVGLVYNIGEVTTSRFEMQRAADAAAYSGAMVQADIASAIAWLNESMAYIYYNACRYAVDNCVLATLAELEDRGAPAEVVGIPNARAAYEAAYTRSAQWIPVCEDWLEQISDMEDALALAAPSLVKKEIWRIAEFHGADKATLFPDIEYFPDPASYQEILIEDRGNDNWHMAVVAGIYQGYTLTIDHLGDGHWRLTSSQGASETWVEIEELGEDFYRVSTSGGYWFTHHQVDENTIEMETSNGETIVSTQTDDGWITVVTTEDGEWVRVVDFGDHVFEISCPLGTIRIRRVENEDGDGYTWEKWNAGSQTWEPLPIPDTVTIGGRTFPVNMTNRIQIGTITLELPRTLHLPNITVHLPYTIRVGRARVRIVGDDLRLTAFFGPATLQLANGNFGIGRGNYILRQGVHDDSIWRANPTGKWRHRLTIPEGNTWTYQYEKEASYFRRDSANRFALIHAMGDNDPYVIGSGGEMPAWAWDGENEGAWFDPRTGKPIGGQHYHQTRTCWNPLDENCPVHGADCGGIDGRWHEYDQDGNVVEVRCPTCQGRQWDEEGEEDDETEVRVFLDDAYARRGEPGLDADDLMTIDMKRFRNPLVLNDSFFKFGVNVGVWKKRNDLPFTVGLMKNAPRWGYIAYASAKAGFYDVDTEKILCQFEDEASRTAWIESYANMYEPTWNAQLWPMRTAVLPFDIEELEDPETGETVQTGASYVFFNIRRAYWYASYEEAVQNFVGRTPGWRLRNYGAPADVRRITAPRDWGGGRLRMISGGEDVDDIIEH